MKKFLACSLAALGLAAPAQAAQNQFYIGADYVYSMNSVDKGNGPMFRNYNPEINYHTDYADDYSLPSINVGYNFSENFGIEAFYMTSGKEKTSITAFGILLIRCRPKPVFRLMVWT